MKCFLLVIFGAIAISMQLSCGGGAPASDAGERNINGFPGIGKLERAGELDWRMTWEQVPDESILYGVYQGGADAPIDYTAAPLATTRKNVFTWRRKNIFDGTNYCFAIRVINVAGDENAAKLCTDDEPYTFPGIESMERQGDGAWLLNWPEINATNVIYQIYSRNPETSSEYDFTLASYFGIKENFYKLPVIERGESLCYVVRYILDIAPPDQNTEEICTPVEEGFLFNGIITVEELNPTSVRLGWDPSPSSFVEGYNIYQGSDFNELLQTVDKTQTTVDVNALASGRQYSFGVRAVDAYGREDNNFINLSIILSKE